MTNDYAPTSQSEVYPHDAKMAAKYCNVDGRQLEPEAHCTNGNRLPLQGVILAQSVAP